MLREEIREILDKDEYNIDDKINGLKTLRDESCEMINKEINKLKDASKWCPHCGKSYVNKCWEKIEVKEKRRVCISWPLVAEDDREYALKDCLVRYRICPTGHKLYEGHEGIQENDL